MKKSTVEFANTGNIVLVEISNELKVESDGWAHIAPIGDHLGMALVDDGHGGLKKVKAIQRVDKGSCEAMKSEFDNARSGLKFMASRPIYVGHPDVKGYESKYPDKAPKGLFTELAVRDTGLYGKPILTPEGMSLVTPQENKPAKYRALSGRWNAEPAGEDSAKGLPVFKPTVFLSAGLTNQPNLPVELLNEADDGENPMERAKRLSHAAHDASAHAYKATSTASLSNTAADHLEAFHRHAGASSAHSEAYNCASTTMKNDAMAGDHDDMAKQHQSLAVQHLKAAKKVGAEPKIEAANEKEIETLANNPDYVGIDLRTTRSRIATLSSERDAARGELVTAKSDAETARGQLAQVKVERDSIVLQRDEANTKFANERNVRIKDELDRALVEGRMTFAERAESETKLKNESQFANELQILRSRKRMKTEQITIDRGAKGKVVIANERERITFFNQMIDEVCSEKKWDRKNQKDYDAACRIVWNTHPELAGQHPQIKR